MKRRLFLLTGLLTFLAALIPAFVRNWFKPKMRFRAKFVYATKPVHPKFAYTFVHRRG